MKQNVASGMSLEQQKSASARTLRIRSQRLTLAALLLQLPAVALHGQEGLLIDLLKQFNPSFETVTEFVLAPDSSYAAFEGLRAGEYGVYSVTLPGAELRQIGPVEPVTQSGLSDLAITSDSRRILFRQGVGDLWSVAQSEPQVSAVNLMACVPEGLSLSGFELLGDQATVLLKVDRDPPYGSRELFLVDVEGCRGRARRLNHALRKDERIGAYRISSDGLLASYTSSFLDDERRYLWVASIADPHPRRVTGVLDQPAFSVFPCEFQPNSQVCVFRADFETAHKVELFATESSPSGIRAKRISGDLPEEVEVIEFELSPAGDWAAYTAARRTPHGGVAEVFATPVTGPTSAARLLSPGGYSEELISDLIDISGDGTSVFFGQARPSTSENELFAVPIEGPNSEARAVSPRVGAGNSLYDPRIAPNSSDLIFALATGATPEIRCFVTSANGDRGAGQPLWTEALRGPIVGPNGYCALRPSGGGVVALLVSPEGPVFEQLFRWAPFAEPADPSPLLLTPSELFSDFVGIKEDFVLSSDGEWVVFRGQTTEGPLSLWARKLPLFFDGFESGTTLHWKSSTGVEVQ